MSSLKAFKQHALQLSENSTSNIPEGFPQTLTYKSGVSQHVSFMHGMSLCFPMINHMIKIKNGEKAYFKNVCCNEMWKLPCDVCGTINSDGETMKQGRFLVGTVHLHNADPADDKGSMRNIEIKPGKGGVNLSALEDAERGGYFMSMDGKPTVWKFHKVGEGLATTYSSPAILPIQSLGPNFKAEIPQESISFVEPVGGLDEETMFAILHLANYGNVPYDLLGIPTPAELAEMITAKPKSNTKHSSKL